MKKIITLLLISTLIFTFAACGGTGNEDTGSGEETGIAGGWTRADSPELTDEQIALFEKAFEELVGAEYTPVAYVASQVVAGTNHLFLVRTSPVVQDPDETYALAIVYEDLDGNAEMVEIIDSGIQTYLNGMMGGWQETDSLAVPEELTAAFEEAKKDLTGADYEPIALLSRQIVSGTNYCLLCESTMGTVEPDRSYSIATLYVDLQGNAEILELNAF